MKKTPITVITGFLGVGKTTLLHQLLTNSKGLKIAVLVNEFGAEGVDGELLQSGCKEEACAMVELANGCICCTVQEEFLPAMQTLIEKRKDIDHIIIETSGLAMPKPLVRAVNWPDLKPFITVNAVITLVDAVGVLTGKICDRERVQAQRLADDSLDHETPIETLFLDQITCADLVLVSKADLVDATQLEVVSKTVKKLARPNTKILPIAQGKIDLEILLGMDCYAEDNLDSRPSIHEHQDEHGHDHEHDESLNSVVIEEKETEDINTLLERLKLLVKENEIYRIKGFVHIPNKPMRMVLQGVGDRFNYYYDRPWQPNESRQTKLVVIGRALELSLEASVF